MFECTSEGVIGLGDLPEPVGSVIKFCTMMSKYGRSSGAKMFRRRINKGIDCYIRRSKV